VLEMKKEFEIADVDRSNAINANELHKVMARMNLNLAPKYVL
jgi:Ca2+-binding EF-hand superfamily protein